MTPITGRYLIGVQGLRTVAAVLVAIYHIWFGRVSGGVDVFFVVAGYFAVGSLYRSYQQADGLLDLSCRLRDYLLKTARRVIPSAVVVISATILLAQVWMPRGEQRAALAPARAAIGFYENWQLISASADYAQQDNSVSPFQQFWALAVNVQFYFLFAVVLWAGIALLVLRRRNDNPQLLRQVFIGIAGTVFAISFAYSVYRTSTNQAAAYFDTFARLWEFMAGSLLFLLMHKGVRNRRVAQILGLLGLLLLLSLGAFFDLSRLLPGFLSLLPVLAACAIIASSWVGAEPIVLKWKPVLVIADSSFALYLWHWPLLVFYRHQVGQDVSLVAGLGIITVSLALAVITTKLIEDPVRKARELASSWWKTLTASATLLLIPVILLTIWTARIDSADSEAQIAIEQLTAQTNIGNKSGNADVAEQLLADESSVEPEFAQKIPTNIDDLVPHPSVALDDFSGRAYAEGCSQSIKGEGIVVCEFGNPEARKTIAVVGGSHSQQWVEAAITAAELSDARVLAYIKSSCLFTDNTVDEFKMDPSCESWNDEIIEILTRDRPDLVLTIGTREREGIEMIPAGYIARFQQLSEAGVKVLALRDNPRTGTLSPKCLEKRGLDGCYIDRDEYYVPFTDLNAPNIPGVEFMDLADLYCGPKICEAHDGIITQYRDSHHLTNTWVLLRGQPVVHQIIQMLSD